MVKNRVLIFLILIIFINSCKKGSYSAVLPISKSIWTKSIIYLSNGDTISVTPIDLNTNYFVEISKKNKIHYFKFFENDKIIFQGKTNSDYTSYQDYSSSYNNLLYIKGQKITLLYYPYQKFYILDKFPFTQPAPDSPTVYYQDYFPVNSTISTSDILYVQNYFEEI